MWNEVVDERCDEFCHYTKQPELIEYNAMYWILTNEQKKYYDCKITPMLQFDKYRNGN